MNKSSFKIKLMIGLLFALAATITVSMVAYNSVSNLVEAIGEESKPNRKLILLNEILSSLSDAESSVRTFSITHDTAYLSPFETTVSLVEEKIEQLRALSHDSVQNIRLDSMEALIKRKYIIQNELLSFSGDVKVAEVLNKIIARISAKEKTATTEIQKTRLSRLKELFRTKEKIVTFSTEQLDDIEKMVGKVKKEEILKAEAGRQREFEFTKTDVNIMASINSLADEFENAELVQSQLRAQKAHRLANLTTVIMTIISGAAVLLVASLAYLVFSFITKTTQYNRELTKAKEHAEKLARVKEEFLANMSHEIRTPMNAILGFSEQLEKTALDPKQKLYTATMKDSIEHLLVVVNDILDHSKLESGKFTFEKTGFKPLEVLSSVYESFRKMAREKNLQLKLETEKSVPRILIGDPYRLKQILYNLIGNAIKFTEEGTVQISIDSNSLENGTVELKITVSDTGIGISPEKVSNIFEDFYQSDSTITRKYGGTGLGLAITKKLVELQNGAITVRSKKGKGSSFSFSLPYSIGEEIDIEQPVNIPEDPSVFLGSISVLIADDEDYNRMLLEAILTRWGMKTTLCTNGKMAVEQLTKAHYDLVLMDVRMPELNGLDATAAIRKLNAAQSEVPVIALTAASSDEDIRKCKAAGMNDFLSKPFREAELFEKICLVMGIDFSHLRGKTSKKPAANSSGSAYDLAELKALSNGDENFVSEMLRTFVQNTNESISKMKEAVLKNDWEKAGLLAHRLAAPCRHLQMKHVVKKLKEIEKAALDKNEHQTIPAFFESLEPEIQSILLQLQQEQQIS